MGSKLRAKLQFSGNFRIHPRPQASATPVFGPGRVFLVSRTTKGLASSHSPFCRPALSPSSPIHRCAVFSRDKKMRLRDQALDTRPFTSDNYFQRPATQVDPPDTARFPSNHVRYSAKLKPVEWLNAVHVRMQSGPLSIERAVLAAFDRAHPMDACLGTVEELTCLRSAPRLLCAGN